VTDTHVRRAAWVVFALGLLALVVRGADAPADPSFASVPRRPLAGFQQVAFHVTTSEGDVLDWCALLAATEAARQQGLMEQDDLLGYDGMVFRFDELTVETFWMFHTPEPLSIAWFDDEGRFISTTDMDPCESDVEAACPLYPAPRPYRFAVEAARGDLGRLGIEPGSRLRIGGSCA
jgi:uncharacterized membrane protein (UPF0127 family)